MYYYCCVHYREHCWYCYADNSYQAAKKAAEYWGRKNTCGVDVYRMNKDHVAD